MAIVKTLHRPSIKTLHLVSLVVFSIGEAKGVKARELTEGWLLG